MKMIGIENTKINDIPSLIISKVEHAQKRLPTLIYYHGFRSGKENNLTIAYLLAEQNYRVILPDCNYHGERFKDISYTERELAFWDIVTSAIAELKDIKGYLDQNDLLLDDRLAVAGTSMGGMVTAGALTQYEWIKSAGLLMSSGKLQDFAHLLIDHYNSQSQEKISEQDKEMTIEHLNDLDLYTHIEKLNNRPLFIWHGMNDDVVPMIHAEELDEKIKTHYGNARVTFIKEENRAHNLSRLAIKESIDFFARYL